MPAAPSRGRRLALLFALASWSFVGCNADERSLSYELAAASRSGSGGLTGAAASAPNAGGTGGDGGDGGRTEAGGGSSGDANMAGVGTDPEGGSTSIAGSAGALAGSSQMAGNDAGGSGGATAGSGAGGAAGEPFTSPCGDLNQNRVDDCEETLVQNSRFDTAASDWTPTGLLQQRWEANDARGAASSGSLFISNTNLIAGVTGNTTLGTGQCLAAWGGQSFEVGARAFIEDGQGAGRAEINLLIFGQDDCGGTVLDGRTPAATETVGSWQVMTGTVKIPPASRSMAVRLVATKPLAQPSFEVLFDDVLVREK